MIGPQRRHPGELEADVLAVLWAGGRALTPGDIQRALGGDLARTTVNTILSRLHEKGVLVRHRVGRAFSYAPAQEAQDAPGLAARRMRSELEKEADRQTVLARFVSGLSDADEQLLRSLLADGDGAADGAAGGDGAGSGAGGGTASDGGGRADGGGRGDGRGEGR
ncbi:BlaI/MecI/CopY family transcriptional regulator [Streptacidiphilus sp. EB129]|uniref:BlaI/MecI/CopY family transcriptional regulator n=1 Tax=Streptacidiphilus sp. EB129 TaxID=3156262 RepID=UPI003518A7B1